MYAYVERLPVEVGNVTFQISFTIRNLRPGVSMYLLHEDT